MPNSISEWFGHRIYPTVAVDALAIMDQREESCPFLSTAPTRASASKQPIRVVFAQFPAKQKAGRWTGLFARTEL
jgi:hypothetical protein